MQKLKIQDFFLYEKTTKNIYSKQWGIVCLKKLRVIAIGMPGEVSFNDGRVGAVWALKRRFHDVHLLVIGEEFEIRRVESTEFAFDTRMFNCG